MEQNPTLGDFALIAKIIELGLNFFIVSNGKPESLLPKVVLQGSPWSGFRFVGDRWERNLIAGLPGKRCHEMGSVVSLFIEELYVSVRLKGYYGFVVLVILFLHNLLRLLHLKILARFGGITYLKNWHQKYYKFEVYFAEISKKLKKLKLTSLNFYI